MGKTSKHGCCLADISKSSDMVVVRLTVLKLKSPDMVAVLLTSKKF